MIANINDFSSHDRIIQAALNRFGKIDVLVNNAGIFHLDNIETIDEDNYDRLMNTNLKSLIFFTKACIPHLMKQKGQIGFIKLSFFFQINLFFIF